MKWDLDQVQPLPLISDQDPTQIPSDLDLTQMPSDPDPIQMPISSFIQFLIEGALVKHLQKSMKKMKRYHHRSFKSFLIILNKSYRMSGAIILWNFLKAFSKKSMKWRINIRRFLYQSLILDWVRGRKNWRSTTHMRPCVSWQCWISSARVWSLITSS